MVEVIAHYENFRKFATKRTKHDMCLFVFGGITKSQQITLFSKYPTN